MAAQLIDIGVNLAHRSFQSDRDAVIRRAQDASVAAMVVTGANARSSQDAQQMAQGYPGVLYSTAGVHPHNAKECGPQTLKLLRDLAAKPEVVAIGECGLDFNRDFSPRPTQEQWFEAQIQLACELKMPLFLHERDAHERFVAVLSKYLDQLPPTVVHCFTGAAAELDAYLQMGLFIGITGWISDERRGQHLKSLVGKIPLDRLMLETDAPFLTPRNMTRRPGDSRNEPSFLPYVLQSVAEAQRKPADQVAAATTQTAATFFNINVPVS